MFTHQRVWLSIPQLFIHWGCNFTWSSTIHITKFCSSMTNLTKCFEKICFLLWNESNSRVTPEHSDENRFLILHCAFAMIVTHDFPLVFLNNIKQWHFLHTTVLCFHLFSFSPLQCWQQTYFLIMDTDIIGGNRCSVLGWGNKNNFTLKS